MSTSLRDANLEKRLLNVTNSQDSIQTLSLWLIHHRGHHAKIVRTWLKVLKKAKLSQRLALFYVANDVIQNSKRKGFTLYRDSFAEVLKDATVLVREKKIKSNIKRVFNVWNDRSIYDSEFVEKLQSILDFSDEEDEDSKDAPTAKLLAEFKYENVIDKLRSVSKIELDTTTKMATINVNKLNATNAEIVQKLKDRSHGQQFSSEFDESSRNLEELVKSLTKEVQMRNELMALLEQSEIFYETQRGEAKVVANAYKSFGTRVKTLQKQLNEVIETFPEPSPVPSPCPDAPSPTTSDLEAELELPADYTPPRSTPSEKTKTSDSTHGITSINSIGEPIPILSSFFNQDKKQMSSWLETFNSRNSPSTNESQAAKDSSSLDSRLSNFMQNIPIIPSSAQNNSKTNSRKTESSSLKPQKNSHSLPPADKDECSGQTTPLQDEEQSGTSSFLNRLSSSSQSSHSRKNVGLPSFIQTASSSSNDSSYKPNADASWHLSQTEPINQGGSFLSNVTTSQNLSPSTFLNPMAEKTIASITSSAENVVAPNSKANYSNKPSDIHKNLSFIPTLVPSTPVSSNFKFDEENFDEEYDPCSQSFDMDIEDGIDEPDSSPNSPTESIPSPSNEDMLPPIKQQRQSTLITLVTDNSIPKSESVSISNNVPVSTPYSVTSFPSDYEKPWCPENSPFAKSDTDITTSALNTPLLAPPPFMMQPPPNFGQNNDHLNGKAPNHPTDWLSSSKIETVQSFRSGGGDKWSRDQWNDYGEDYPHRSYNQPLSNQVAQGYPDLKRYQQPQNFQPRKWEPRFHHSRNDRGQPRKHFQSSRGQGWNRPRHPY